MKVGKIGDIQGWDVLPAIVVLESLGKLCAGVWGGLRYKGYAVI